MNLDSIDVQQFNENNTLEEQNIINQETFNASLGYEEAMKEYSFMEQETNIQMIDCYLDPQALSPLPPPPPAHKKKFLNYYYMMGQK